MHFFAKERAEMLRILKTALLRNLTYGKIARLQKLTRLFQALFNNCRLRRDAVFLFIQPSEILRADIALFRECTDLNLRIVEMCIDIICALPD